MRMARQQMARPVPSPMRITADPALPLYAATWAWVGIHTQRPTLLLMACLDTYTFTNKTIVYLKLEHCIVCISTIIGARGFMHVLSIYEQCTVLAHA